jgi:hypothetical protein
MSDENLFDFYETLGFEETDIEDGLTALFFELDSGGSYSLITNEDGAIPETLKERVVFACYSPDGAFLWSVGFKNSYVFRDTWAGSETAGQRLAAVEKYRAGLEYYKA